MRGVGGCQVHVMVAGSTRALWSAEALMYPAGSPSPARYANARCRSRLLARLSWLTPSMACSAAGPQRCLPGPALFLGAFAERLRLYAFFCLPGPTFAKSGKPTRRSLALPALSTRRTSAGLCGRHRIASSRDTSGAPTRSRPSELTSANSPVRDCRASSGTCRTRDLSRSYLLFGKGRKRGTETIRSMKLPPYLHKDSRA